MKRLFQILLYGYLSVFTLSYCHAQSSTIYLHTDRDYYLPGDTVWFKGYFTKDGTFARNLHNMYMKLIDVEGNELWRSVALINDGVTASYFRIPPDYSGSEIFINANTVLDSCAESRPYFKKLGIMQLTSSEKETDSVVDATGLPVTAVRLSIHPEGGVLLSGLENKLILRGFDGTGYPALLKGTLQDDKGIVLTDFETDSAGLADVLFTMDTDRKYSLNWTDASGGNHQNQLPVAVQGARVNLIEQDSVVFVQLQTNQETQAVVVSVVIGKRKLFDHELVLKAGKKINIPVKRRDLEYGILQASLSDTDQKVISRRSLLVGEHKILITPIVTFNNAFKEKSAGKVSVRLPNGIKVAKLSVSVTDQEVAVDTTQSILTDLYLQSLIQEPLLNPQLFWDRARNKDLFIQIQNWDYGCHSTTDSAIFDPLLTIKGQIELKGVSWSKFYADYENEVKKGLKKNIPARGASFGYQDKVVPQMQYSEVMFDKVGKFEIPNFVVFDSLDTKFVQIYRKLKFTPFTVKYGFADQRNYPKLTFIQTGNATHDTKQLENKRGLRSDYFTVDASGKRVLQVAEVVRTRREREIDRLQKRFKASEPSTAHEPDMILLPLMDSVVIKTSQSLWEYMNRNLNNPSGITIILNGKFVESVGKIRADQGEMRGAPMVNKNEKEEYAFLNEDVSNYPFMKFYRTYNSTESQRTLRNVLVVFEYSPEEKDRDIGSSEYREIIAGYMPMKAFSNKMYASEAERLSSGRDNRLTLYWDPFFDFTAQHDSKELVFYNNSSNTGVWVTIQGLTETGEVIYYRKRMNE